MRKTDQRLKREVEQELRWDPMTSAADIRVSVADGTVSLAGAVDTCAVKWAASAATRRIGGVRAVAQQITVSLLPAVGRTDAELTAAARSVLRANLIVPSTVTARVDNAWVTLEGWATWSYEREAAERAVSQIAGVTGVHDQTVEPPLPAACNDERASARPRVPDERG